MCNLKCTRKHTLAYIVCFFVFVLHANPIQAGTTELDTLFKKADSFKNRNIDSVIHYANIALEETYTKEDPGLEGKTLIYLAKANLKAGNLSEAVVNCTDAESIATISNYFDLEVEALMIKGVAFQMAGLSSDALTIFLDAQKFKNDINDFDVIIDLYFYIGLSYAELNEIAKSKSYLQASIKIAKEKDFALGTYKSYILLSNISNKLDSIQYYLDLAESVIEEEPELAYEKAALRNNQALINKAAGKYELAKKQYSEAIQIARSNGFDEYLANFYNNFAYLLMAQHKYDSAGIVLDEALQIAKEIGNLDLQASVYDSYADYFAAVGRHDMAFVYQDSSFVKRNQYREQQRIQESRFLSVVFETEQKEKEILTQESEINRLWIFAFAVLAFLVAAISAWLFQLQKSKLRKARLNTVEKEKELDVANAMIQGQNVERERLAMDLHDGLGSRLSVLKFTVENFFKKNERYEEVYDSIKDIHKGVRELSHRMLPAQLENIGLIDTIRNMATELSKSDKYEVGFETNIEGRLPHDLELNLYYLIFELVNNATKHSNGNSIFIQLMDFDDHLNLSVEDNGGNFSLNQHADGVGIRNIKTRVKYLGGKLMIEPSPSETLFIIEIPT